MGDSEALGSLRIQSVFTKGGAREKRPPPGVEKRMFFLASEIWFTQFWWGLFSCRFLDNVGSFFQHLDDYAGDHKVPVPFVVRWYEVPRRPFRAGLIQRILVCLHVFLPEFSFRKVVTAELPPLGRIV